MNPTSKPSPPSSSTETEEKGGATTNFSMLHPDIIESHILNRLDRPILVTTSCSSATLCHLSSQEHIGPRAFFVSSFPLPLSDPTTDASHDSRSSPPSELISAVDLYYRNKMIFTKVKETEIVTGWFRCSSFRIDLLEPNDVVPTPIKHPEGDDMCTTLVEDMTLSWILIDPIGRRAVNLSSHKPVTVQRHWLSGEVQSEGGEMLHLQVREVSMEMEDMDGMHLNGRDSLVILQKALEGRRGKALNREEEGRRRYKEYVEMKRERREKKMRTEGALDILFVAFGSIFVGFLCFLWWR
ncbi:hypothetical protein ACH5RR_004534 [Cinchona calisaya]|uniref:F-box protein n=1 Tax=Cinchona calisaya TaxID=153742 RepID=A0ABD3AYG7_9GENT